MIKLKLYNTFWVYILPGMFTFYNMVIFMSFFRSIPESLIESARLDGASEFTVYWKIVMPNAKPVIATIGLFTAVYHWNDYYQGVVYIRDKTLEPLQTILYKLLAETSMTAQQQQAMLALGGTTTSATVKYAAMFVGALPILCLYPFIQKYLVKGVMLGAIKG
jgi:putative aldouronate transport system permease protein